jgi:hypothetical protein
LQTAAPRFRSPRAARTSRCDIDFAARGGGVDHPAHRQRLAARRADFDRHRSRATDAADHLDHRLDVVERLRQQVDRLLRRAARLVGHALDRAIDDALGHGLLAALHDHVHELGQQEAVELRVRQDDSDRGL